MLAFVDLFAGATGKGCYQQELFAPGQGCYPFLQLVQHHFQLCCFSSVAPYVSTLQTNWRREKLKWNPTRHMRLSPELSLKQKFTLNHVQLMKLLPMFTIKLNAINFVIFVWLSGLYTVVSLNWVVVQLSMISTCMFLSINFQLIVSG